MRFLPPTPLSKRHTVTNPITVRVSCVFRVSQTTRLCDTLKIQVVLQPSAFVTVRHPTRGVEKEREKKMSTDRRRYRVIVTQQVNADTFHLTIDGQLWSEIEWSPSRRAWCIQDACGFCLAHVESIVGQDRDVQTAIRLAKRMIISGEMPTPEEAEARVSELGEWCIRDATGHDLMHPEDSATGTVSGYSNRRDSAKDRRRYGIVETRWVSRRSLYRLVIEGNYGPRSNGLGSARQRRGVSNCAMLRPPSVLPGR
jgi:hypothetical protein